jgi:GNAT superfamily N-acetyltransferase
MKRAAVSPNPPRKRSARAPRDARSAAAPIEVRAVRRGDLDSVIDLDATVTGLEKRKYWLSVYRRYGSAANDGQQFLVALYDGRVAGFIIGEVRDWEFGSAPCGWVFAIDVDPRVREAGVGTLLLAAIAERFKRIGVRKLRTIVARENTLILSFFRSQGMMAGPLVALETDLEP